ncbi:hypothetical protein Nepgr_006913 [Nepenthes gracilis]|uniref:Uncharacterized protein n=1 Tax=Nepenthes gracilis TaxID=150966 RepID=A0AAD3S5W6_NEPGR|nr:hypothetical protein Nepgr_006913 [Nepenthes gracilis]
MVRTENQKQLLSWISDYASDSSQKERRVVNLKKQIHQLRCKIDAACAELENAKLLKETTEQALRGYEVELAIAEASVQTTETRIASSQYEISTVGSDVEALKNQEGAMRDKFIKEMFDFNCEIRRFHALVSSSISEESCTRGSSARADQDCRGRNDAEFIALGREISSVASEIITKEQECEQEKDLQQRTPCDKGMIVFDWKQADVQVRRYMYCPE